MSNAATIDQNRLRQDLKAMAAPDAPALIIVAGRGSQSHRQFRYTVPVQRATGAEVLMHTVLRRANHL